MRAKLQAREGRVAIIQRLLQELNRIAYQIEQINKTNVEIPSKENTSLNVVGVYRC